MRKAGIALCARAEVDWITTKRMISSGGAIAHTTDDVAKGCVRANRSMCLDED